MSITRCWRCQKHKYHQALPSSPSLTISTTAPSRSHSQPHAHNFSTTTTNLTTFKKGRSYTFRRSGQSGEGKGRPPAVGERRAQRKRIVLSNTNALEVPDLPELSGSAMAAAELVGNVVTLPPAVVDRLRAVEAFRPTQAWKLLRRPAMLVRAETERYAREMEEPGDRVHRRIIAGPRASGKSLMLLQAMALAFMKNWLVIHIPEAQDLVNGHTDYAPIPSTTPPLYFQKAYTAALLQRIARAHPTVLQPLRLALPHSLPLPSTASLHALATVGAADPNLAWPAFHHLVSELALPSTPTHPRPKLLLSLDGLAHAMRPSAYRTPAFQPIHAHELALLDWFTRHLAGRATLPNGGMVLAATSSSNAPTVPALALRLAQLEARQLSPDAVVGPPRSLIEPFLIATGQPVTTEPAPDPYVRYDERVMDVLGSEGLQVQRMAGVERGEARALMEYWARSGMMRGEVNESLVGEKWSLSAAGLVGELERGCLRMRI